jgi:hypothetical protein
MQVKSIPEDSQVKPLRENPTIAVIVPTIRPELFENEFLPKWKELFYKHGVNLCVVKDGDDPIAQMSFGSLREKDRFDFCLKEEPVCEWRKERGDVFYNRTDAIRNFGFYIAKEELDPDIYISLDDDVSPLPGSDPIQDHIDAFRQTETADWYNTHGYYRMRGLPYKQVPRYPLLSHGVWKGVPDFDAIMQLQHPDVRDLSFPSGVVPKHAFFPVCAMNMAFRKELLPWAYQAPMGIRTLEETGRLYDRFADIWAGVTMKFAIDNLFDNACAVTGYSVIYHERASDVFVNLRKEAAGMELNETIAERIDLDYNGGGFELDNLSDSDKKYLQIYAKRLIEWRNLIQD